MPNWEKSWAQPRLKYQNPKKKEGKKKRAKSLLTLLTIIYCIWNLLLALGVSWPQSMQQVLSTRGWGLTKEKANSGKKCEMPVYRNVLPTFRGTLLSANICARHFLLLTFLFFSCCFLGFFFSYFPLLPFPFVFFPHSLCLGYSRLACSLKWCRKITLMAAVRHFGILPAARWKPKKKKKNALTFSHLAGQLKRHNACTAASQPAKSLTWPTCSGIFNLCAMRLHKYARPVHPVAPCVAHAICMQQSVRKIDSKRGRRRRGGRGSHTGWKGEGALCFCLALVE